jgi:hypothetical protein
MFFYWKYFFSDVPVQVLEHIWKQLEASFRKMWGQIWIRIRKKNFVDPNPKKWVRIHNTGSMLHDIIGATYTLVVSKFVVQISIQFVHPF